MFLFVCESVSYVCVHFVLLWAMVIREWREMARSVDLVLTGESEERRHNQVVFGGGELKEGNATREREGTLIGTIRYGEEWRWRRMTRVVARDR